MRFFQNIKVRLTLWYLLITTLVIVFFSVMAYIILSDSLSQLNIYPWDIQIAQIEKTPDGNHIVTDFTDISQQTGINQYNEIVVAQSYSWSQLLESVSDDNAIEIDTVEGQSISIDKSLLSNPGVPGDAQIWFYLFLSENNPEEYQLFVINQSLTSAVFTLGAFKKTLIITVIVTLAFSGILGFFLVRRMLKPLQTITQTAQEIEEKDLNKRFNVTNYDELGNLAATLNRMFERLQNAFRRERQFTADASHELRTPLTILLGESTLALQKERTVDEYRKSLEMISQESGRMATILKKLLFLARSESDRPLEYEEVNLMEFLNDLVSDTETLRNQESIQIKVIAEDNLVVKGDRLSLRELFLNLLDNAIRYTPQGGDIVTTVSKKGNNACIAVKDSGIGIPEDHLNHIFERFYRVDKSRSRNEGGSGLGLAISQRIAEFHNGTISVDSKIGEGSTFTVYLPLNEKPD